ncbi:amino acid--tRNA ligase-related protein [Hymenobacter sp. DG01]|uniref:amino acid--tRNA ligase-related protein n=1 Tax=Hymenobacter sp. DG01 TaxID=2584940 RepID=UPI001121C8DB|nr:amino acid--tRNA ligase-related protein [Hymenobacter sp. DG01]
MNDSVTLAQQMVAAAPAATCNVNLSTAFKWMENTAALFSVAEHKGRTMFLPLASDLAGLAERDSDADKLLKSSMLQGLLRQGMKLKDFNSYLNFHKEHDVKLHSGAGVGMARVARFILGQQDIRDCVPFLISRDNVI